MIGKVLKYNRLKGHGYIEDKKTGNIYYCNAAHIIEGELRKGYLVDYQIYYDKKRDEVYAWKIQTIEAR